MLIWDVMIKKKKEKNPKEAQHLLKDLSSKYTPGHNTGEPEKKKHKCGCLC